MIIYLIAKSPRVQSEETRKKIGDAQRGDKNHMHGKRHTDEVKARMSASHKARWIKRRARQARNI
jgi:hypothetical protein